MKIDVNHLQSWRCTNESYFLEFRAAVPRVACVGIKSQSQTLQDIEFKCRRETWWVPKWEKKLTVRVCESCGTDHLKRGNQAFLEVETGRHLCIEIPKRRNPFSYILHGRITTVLLSFVGGYLQLLWLTLTSNYDSLGRSEKWKCHEWLWAESRRKQEVWLWVFAIEITSEVIQKLVRQSGETTLWNKVQKEESRVECGVFVPKAKEVICVVSVRGRDSAGMPHAADLEIPWWPGGWKWGWLELNFI